MKGDEDAVLGAFRQNQQKWKQASRMYDTPSKKYCRFCFLSKKNRTVYTSHKFGDLNCPSLSQQDKKNILETAKLYST